MFQTMLDSGMSATPLAKKSNRLADEGSNHEEQTRCLCSTLAHTQQCRIVYGVDCNNQKIWNDMVEEEDGVSYRALLDPDGGSAASFILCREE